MATKESYERLKEKYNAELKEINDTIKKLKDEYDIISAEYNIFKKLFEKGVLSQEQYSELYEKEEHLENEIKRFERKESVVSIIIDEIDARILQIEDDEN